MPPLTGFSDNLFNEHENVRKAALALLQSLCRYQSAGGARIQLPVATGVHFDETAAQLEGFARPLWAVGALLADGNTIDQPTLDLAKPFIRGLANGTDPKHPEYWGPVVVRDQRMVEMEIVAFALLAAPNAFFHSQTSEAKANITTWLQTINGKDMPAMNWLWFRVLTNLALILVCGMPQERLCALMKVDLDLLDTFYISNGWSSDGLWSEQGRQADYYSGSFAIQFSQLMYVTFAKDLDPERCDVYRERARQFSVDFIHYFDQAGAAIPFGRSLTYRFAFAGFWSAAAYAEVELPQPVKDLGVVKGLLLRHFRWWTSKHDMFNSDGTMNIGFLYPNMYMSEDYNSPQSVYWCMKSFCSLALSKDHPFWTVQEQPFPSTSICLTKEIKAPMHIVSNTSSHHFILSSGQFCPWPLKATEAKYGKFAYSSHFGFSVPTGQLIQQIAPDSTLALRACEGDVWKARWIPRGARFSTATLVTDSKVEQVPVLVSSWRPWQLFDVNVCTALIAPSTRWPDWHVRVHKISIGPQNHNLDIHAVEGGFAINGRRLSDGLPIHAGSARDCRDQKNIGDLFEKSFTGEAGCLVCSVDGASGIRKLHPQFEDSLAGSLLCRSEGSLLKPDANTNLMRQRTVIPTLMSAVPSMPEKGCGMQFLACGVFALANQRADLLDSWDDIPFLRIGESKDYNGKAYIQFGDW